MNPEEREGIFSIKFSNRIEVAYVPTPDCICGVVAMTINTLTSSPDRTITGFDIQQILQDTKTPKGQFNQIFEEVGKKFGIRDVEMKALVGIPLDPKQRYELFTALIDNGALISLGIKAKQWYKMIGYPKEVPEIEHAVLICGYRFKRNKLSGNIESLSLLIKDPNLKQGISVQYDKLCQIMGKTSQENVIFFYNKNNKNIDKITVSIQ